MLPRLFLRRTQWTQSSGCCLRDPASQDLMETRATADDRSIGASNCGSLELRGAAVVPVSRLFSADDVRALDELQSRFMEERVSSGDDDERSIYVRRIVTDKPGERPVLVHSVASAAVLAVLDQPGARAYFEQVFGGGHRYYIRRVQSHRLVKGSYIGLHLDVESNPENEFSVVIPYERSFEGGEFVVHVPGGAAEVF